MENISIVHQAVTDLLRGGLQQQGFKIRGHLLDECNLIPQLMEYIQKDRFKFEYVLVNEQGRHTKKEVPMSYVSHFIQLLNEIKSMEDMDMEISDIFKKIPNWTAFKTKYLLHQGDQEEAKAGMKPDFNIYRSGKK